MRRIGDRLIRVVLLLFVYSSVQILISYLIAINIFILTPEINSFTFPILHYSYLIGNSLFAIAIFLYLREHRKIAASVSLLSVFNPILGSLFYFIATYVVKNETTNEVL